MNDWETKPFREKFAWACENLPGFRRFFILGGIFLVVWTVAIIILMSWPPTS